MTSLRVIPSNVGCCRAIVSAKKLTQAWLFCLLFSYSSFSGKRVFRIFILCGSVQSFTSQAPLGCSISSTTVLLKTRSVVISFLFLLLLFFAVHCKDPCYFTSGHARLSREERDVSTWLSEIDNLVVRNFLRLRCLLSRKLHASKVCWCGLFWY